MALERPRHQTRLNSPDSDTVHTRPATPAEVAYRNGYVNGRTDQRHQADRYRTQDSNRVANGVLLGIILASLVGVGTAIVYALSRSSEPVAPQVEQPANRETTIIERRQEVVPVVPPSVEAPDVTVPDINIDVQNPLPESAAEGEAPVTGDSPASAPASEPPANGES